MLNETYVENTIKEWVKEHSVPFNKPIPESAVKCFTRTGSIETFDELTQCNFINYNGEILIVDEFKDGYDTFKQHFTHSKHDWNPEVFGSLVDALIVNKHIAGDSVLDDAYEISNDKILAVAKFFDFYPNLEKLIEERGNEEYHGIHDCSEGCIMFEGDDWDYDVIHFDEFLTRDYGFHVYPFDEVVERYTTASQTMEEVLETMREMGFDDPHWFPFVWEDSERQHIMEVWAKLFATYSDEEIETFLNKYDDGKFCFKFITENGKKYLVDDNEDMDNYGYKIGIIQ